MRNWLTIVCLISSGCGFSDAFHDMQSQRDPEPDAGILEERVDTGAAEIDASTAPALSERPLEELLQTWCDSTNGCDLWYECPGAEPPEIFEMLEVFDSRSCHEYFGTEYTACELIEEVEAGEISVNRSVLEYCLENERFCDRCPGAFSGARGLGESCYSDWHCSGEGTYCHTPPIDYGVCPDPEGVCEELRAAGESCADNARCQRPAYCIDDVCESPRPEGADCSEVPYCQSGMMCDGSGVCVPVPGEGETCVYRDDDYGYCADDHYCDDQVCVRYRTEGEACDLTDGPRCDHGLWCNNDGACEPLGLEGDSCGSRFRGERPCIGGLRCRDDVCQRVGYIGDPCDSSTYCFSGLARCKDGICVPARYEGAPCDPEQTYTCSDGACVEGVCVDSREAEACRLP